MSTEPTTQYLMPEKNGFAQKTMPISKAKELYKSNISETYPPLFFQNIIGCKQWQISIGQCIGKKYQIKSAVDFGCGVGYYLCGFKAAGATNVLGFDGAYENAKKYIPASVIENIGFGNIMEKIDCGKFDLAMSIEAAEHILPEKSEMLVNNIVNASSKYVLFTAAIPGQGGECHINEQPRDFWISMFKKNGFCFSQKDVDSIASEMKRFTCVVRSKYFDLIRRQIMFFRRAS